MNQSFLQKLRLAGIIEGISTLVLFGIAMPLKYLADMPIAVTIVGGVHGGLFLMLVGMALWAVRRVPIPPKLALMVMIAAVFPFGPFIVDRKLKALQ